MLLARSVWPRIGIGGVRSAECAVPFLAEHGRLGVWPTLLGIVLLSLPTLVFICWNRDVPHFGVLEDDGIYFISAKTFVTGSGYRILSLPGEPYQTKYPPLYPLYLSLAWRANPSFPANLTLAVMLSWLALPAVLLLTLAWLRRHGVGERSAWIVVALLALNPYVLFFVSNLGSELFFTALLFAAILTAERTER